MAVNRSDDDDVNGESSESTLAQLGRLARKAQTKSVRQQDLERRSHQAEREINYSEQIVSDPAVLANYAAMAEKPMSSEQAEKELLSKIARGRKTIESVDPQLDLIRKSKIEGINSQASNVISRAYSMSGVNGEVTEAQRNRETQLYGATMQQQGWEPLEQKKKQLQQQISRMGAENKELANVYVDERTGKVDPGIHGKFSEDEEKRNSLVTELGRIAAAQKGLKQEGLDPESQQQKLFKTGASAAQLIRTNQFQQDAANKTGLGALSREELDKKQAAAATALTEALKQLKAATNATEDELKKLDDAAKKAAAEYEEATEFKEANGGGEKDERGKIALGALGEALQMVGQGFDKFLIQMPLQQVQNDTATANMANEQYELWKRGTDGDMSARLQMGYVSQAVEFGDMLGDRTKWGQIARGAGHTATAALGVVQGGEVAAGGLGEFVGNSRVQAGAEAAKNVLGGGLGVATEIADAAKGITATQNRVAGYHATMAAGKAFSHVQGYQLQEYRDYVMGLNGAASEMGGGAGEAFLNQTGGNDFLEKMKVQGVGLKEMGQLSATGAQMMGSRFSADQAIGAVALENLGHGTAMENMTRMGKLGAAGANDPNQNLQKIIEEGMQRGLNSSKAIDMIVENTARMTEENAKMGGYADPTDFLTKAILGATDANNPNKEQAARIAYDTYQAEEGARHNTAASLSGIINVDRNMKDTGVKDRVSGMIMTNIPTSAINAYKGNGEGLKTFLEGRGVKVDQMDPEMFKNDKLLNILNRNGSIAELGRQSGLGWALQGKGAELLAEIEKNKGNKRVQNALVYGNDPNALTQEQRALRQGVAQAYGLEGKNAGAGIANAASLAGVFTRDKENEKKLSDEENSTRRALQQEGRRGNVRAAGAAQEGGKLLGSDEGGATGIKNLAESGRIAFEKAGVDAEKKWATAARDTAVNFGKSADLLNKATGKLDATAQNLMQGTATYKATTESIGATVKSVMAQLEKLPDAIKRKFIGEMGDLPQ